MNQILAMAITIPKVSELRDAVNSRNITTHAVEDE